MKNFFLGYTLQRATDMARSMVTEYGMSERFGPHAMGGAPRSLFLGGGNGASHLDISEATRREVDEEVEKILDGAYARARDILTERRADLEALTARLLGQETIGGDELRAALGVGGGAERGVIMQWGFVSLTSVGCLIGMFNNLVRIPRILR